MDQRGEALEVFLNQVQNVIEAPSDIGFQMLHIRIIWGLLKILMPWPRPNIKSESWWGGPTPSGSFKASQGFQCAATFENQCVKGFKAQSLVRCGPVFWLADVLRH